MRGQREVGRPAHGSDLAVLAEVSERRPVRCGSVQRVWRRKLLGRVVRPAGPWRSPAVCGLWVWRPLLAAGVRSVVAGLRALLVRASSAALVGGRVGVVVGGVAVGWGGQFRHLHQGDRVRVVSC